MMIQENQKMERFSLARKNVNQMKVFVTCKLSNVIPIKLGFVNF